MSTNEPSLPPRAGIALLTLQLRAALQEATEAEAAGAINHVAAREQLRARLDPLVDAQRRALDRGLCEAQAEADAKVAAAHRAATVMATQVAKRAAVLAEAALPISARIEPAMPPVAALYDEEAVASVENARAAEAPRPAAEVERPITQVISSFSAAVFAPPAVVVSQQPAVCAITDTVAAPADVREMSSFAPPMPPTPPTPPPPPAPTKLTSTTTTVVIDAEAFATVFATVFASVLDERLSALGTGLAPWAGHVPSPVGPAPVKQSFWAHARHTDVLLLTFAMVIALVILAAWLA